MIKKQKLTGGLYLVIDPATERKALLAKLQLALQENIAAVQVWDNFTDAENIESLLRQIIACCHDSHVPVLINNRWQLLQTLPLDGVHFNEPPTDFESIQQAINRPFIAGITCNNDLAIVKWADQHQFDYISFCSLFPSSTSNSCELVHPETVQRARRITSLPLFLAGGIVPGNLHQLQQLPYDGIAVVSGIMSADNPATAAQAYIHELKK
jgi:thiamine-phosphate pyrophosphorylase